MMPRWWIRLLLWYCGYTYVWRPIPDRESKWRGYYCIEKGEHYRQRDMLIKIGIDSDCWGHTPLQRLYLHKSLLPHLKTGNLPYLQ